MHKKNKKKAAGQKECISKSKKHAKGSQKKKKTEQQFKKKQKKRKKMQKNAHAQPNFTHHLFCAILFDVCAICLHVFAFFVRFFFASFLRFLNFLRFLKETHKQCKKKRKKPQIQSESNAKAKTRTFLIAFVLLFDCMFFAFVVHFCCTCLVDKCVFSRMRSEGFSFNSWGSGGRALFATRCFYVRNRPQPSAVGR